MPLKLNVGLNRKVGEAHYGSRGASVNLEIELDGQLVAEPAKLQERIRQCFGLVRAALDEELTGSNGPAHVSPSPTNGQQARPRLPMNASGQGTGPFNGARGYGPRPVTPNQKKALYAIARAQGVEIDAFLREHFGVNRPDDLTVKQASEAIDALKADAPAS